jgi:glycosyltransferase involved in cell wall biosynthesis
MDGRAASQTITDKIPFMIAEGIQPVVLSAPTGDRDDRFPHYQVISPAPSGVLFELRHIIKKRFPNRYMEKGLKALLTVFCLPFLVVEKLLVQLDSQWSWFLSATFKGFFLTRRFKPELIYSTAGPPSTHVAGYFLHKMTGIPWLAEVHDPLIQNDERPRWHNYFFKKWLERRIWEHASAVVYFTEKARQSAGERNPGIGNSFVLRPGAVAPDLTGVSYEKRQTLHFGHFGSLAEGRNLAAVIRAMHVLLEENPAWLDFLKLDIYGADLDSVSRRFLRQYPLKGVVNLHGRLEYDPVTGKSGRQQVLEAMRKSDALLLIHGTGEAVGEYIPSKLYEYLYAKRPIIGLVSAGSELETILKDTGHPVADQTDFADVKRVIENSVARWFSSGLESPDTESMYTVDKTVRKLIKIVDGFR